MVLQFNRFGGPEMLEFRYVVPPAPAGGEVRYRVEAFALSRGDLFWIEDRY